MARRPKDIGTEYETKIVNQLKAILPDLDITRTEAGRESWDIRGLGFPVECKVRKSWSIPAWVRKLRRIAADDAGMDWWALFVSDRDLRRKDSPGEIVVLPKSFFYALIHNYLQENSNDQDID